jgi:TrkA domain protein
MTNKGLVVQQLPLHPKSPYAGKPLGDTKARTAPASPSSPYSVNEVHLSPRPDFVLKSGDLIAVVGTENAIEKLAAILDGNELDSS